MNLERLMREAEKAAKLSYSPYSNVRVGAALLSASGKMYLGANIGNACSALNCCAEQTALVSGLMGGDRLFLAVAVTQPGAEAVLPCGRCLQLLSEFADDMTVVVGTSDKMREHSLHELLPHPYVRPTEETP